MVGIKNKAHLRLMYDRPLDFVRHEKSTRAKPERGVPELCQWQRRHRPPSALVLPDECETNERNVAQLETKKGIAVQKNNLVRLNKDKTFEEKNYKEQKLLM